jgi:hypothetical protein
MLFAIADHDWIAVLCVLCILFAYVCHIDGVP